MGHTKRTLKEEQNILVEHLENERAGPKPYIINPPRPGFLNYETFYGVRHIGNFVELTECIEALVKAAFKDGARKASLEGESEEIERWNAVHEALEELYELWARQGSKGTTLGALENLVRAYDKWLD